MKKLTDKKGFTLIELLIVIAIIGVLSALLMSNFIGVRQRARDAERKSDLRQIQSALELYRSDQGSYPSDFPTCAGGTSFSNNTTVYMSKIPCDPNNTGFHGGDYYYSSDGNNYTLVACLENSSDGQGVSSSDSSFPSGLDGSSCNTNTFYILTNP